MSAVTFVTAFMALGSLNVAYGTHMGSMPCTPGPGCPCDVNCATSSTCWNNLGLGPNHCDTACNPGYGLDSGTSTCIACDANCAVSCTVSGAGYCDGNCDPGFANLNNRCFPCDVNCLGGCNTDGAGYCDDCGSPPCCASGYSLKTVGSKHYCAACDSNCAGGCSTDGPGYCDVCGADPDCCNSGYALATAGNGKHYCGACDPQCTGDCGTSGVGKCDAGCNAGYGLDTADMTCKPCHVNCLTSVGCAASGPGFCDACSPPGCASCDTNFGLKTVTGGDICAPCATHCSSGCVAEGGGCCDSSCSSGTFNSSSGNCPICS